jgi:putative ABC transport system permease protein
LVWAAAASIVVLGAAAVMVGTLFRVLAERRLLGMYRAIGASASFVIATLALEAGIVGVLGGAVGTVLGLGVAAARVLAAGTALHIPWLWVLLGASTGVVANTLGALVPALLAVREAPLTALRAR